MNILALALFIVLVIWMLVYLKIKKINPLNINKKLRFIEYLNQIRNLNSSNEQIIELDKLLDQVMKCLGYRWTLWQKISYANIFINKGNIKHAHYVRNKIAHEIEYKIPNREKEQVISSYIREINNLLK